MLSLGTNKALDCLRIRSVTRAQGDLEFLFLRWSVKSHTFVVVCREFASTLEDVLKNITLPLCGETKVMSSNIGDDKDKL